MKTPRFSLALGLLLALLPVAGRAAGQGQPATGKSPVSAFTYTREKAAFDDRWKGRKVQGTLTIPRGDRTAPAILFVTGARNGNGEAEELRSLADYLGEHGIAVLQIDPPPGGRSVGDFSSAISTEFESDLRAGLTYLKERPEINSRQIGLFGLNENGAIATVVASLTREVSFLILGGTAITENGSASGSPNSRGAYDLRPILKRVTCPVLVLQGDQDTKLPLRENLTAFRNALLAGKNRDTAFAALPGLNRELETTTATGQSNTVMAPLAMQTLARWVYRHAPVKDTSDRETSDVDEYGNVTRRKPSNPFGDVPGGVIGQFRFRRDMLWVPPIAGQPRPYGYWYW